ncbi:MAG TPA: hypothetical protein VFK54_00290 [Candidatus Limnocylindrales bacterium]|nr:hypothetical protein [Candidatus Limnocylindrales bacterium]
MTSVGRILVPAVGGVRQVPAPDPIARDYLLLVLRLDQHVPGLVDAYFGPADLKAQVDMENRRTPGRLAEDAAALRDRLSAEVAGDVRRAWLEVQLLALETQARGLAGDELPYLEHVARCFAHEPVRRPDDEFLAAGETLDALVPGPGPLDARLEAEEARWTVDREAAGRVVDRLLERLRERAREQFGLPDGEAVHVSFVSNQPWGGYNHFDGGRRSRIDINTDLPVRIPKLVHLLAHETYPGHHLEGSTKEAELVDGRGWLEHAVLAINTPENLIGEGLADLGAGFAVGSDEEADLYVELAEIAGLPIAGDPAVLRDAAARRVRIGDANRRLRAVPGNAALMRHVDGADRETVIRYLVDVGRQSVEAATKRLEFIDHPLWRTYIFVYHEGEALLRRWVDLVPDGERVARFGRLLREPFTPPRIRAEIAGGVPYPVA